MKRKLIFLIHTEYHLLLTIYYLYKYDYLFSTKAEITLLISAGKYSRRLDKSLDFESLPVQVEYIDIDRSFKDSISPDLKDLIIRLEKQGIDEFSFFQEQDFLAVILLRLFRKKNTTINLFQDGLKPYITESLGFTPSLHLIDFKMNKYIKKNGFKVNDWMSIFKCHKYGFLKGIDNLYLTFPKAFPRKHKNEIIKLDFKINTRLLRIYQKIFSWTDSLLNQKEKVIFFLNQPMQDDGSFDLYILKKLKERYPENPIIIKNHPHTPQEKINRYNEISDVTIINSRIPAEIFIATLRNSLILSVCSTAMFVDNPECKFYYLYNIEEMNNIERLKKYTVINPTSHVLTPQSVDDIGF